MLEPPQKELGDKIIGCFKAAINQIPVAGAISTEISSWFVKTPYEKRQEEWQAIVSDILNELQTKGVLLESLQKNEEFFDFLLKAIQIGIRNHTDEKREALRKAIMNAALPQAPDFTLQLIFLNYIDVFTEWHIKILVLINNPNVWFQKNNQSTPGMGGVSSVKGVIQAAYPALSQGDLINLIWAELYSTGLLICDKAVIDTGITVYDALRPRTTMIGQQFIEFITQ